MDSELPSKLPVRSRSQDEPFDADRVEDGTQTLVRPAPKTKTPSFYKVLLLNDDFTPRDFVVHVLQTLFRKNPAEATQLMLQVHHEGTGVAGVFTHEIAETKARQVVEYARENRYPLNCKIEKA